MHTPSSASQDHAHFLMEKGLEASRNGEYAIAIDFFQRSSSAAPEAAPPCFLLGSEYAAAGEIEKAESAFTRAILLAPHESVYRYQLGLLQLSSKRVPEALLTWSSLLQLDINSPYPHFVLGFAELSCDGFEKAREHFERGIKVNTILPALNNDIRKVLQSIQALQQTPEPNDESSITPEIVNDHGEETLHHILLSNYQHDGKPH